LFTNGMNKLAGGLLAKRAIFKLNKSDVLHCSFCSYLMSISEFQAQSEVEAIPKHERLRAYLMRELDAGRLRPGDALPTEHALASSAGVSRNTVRQALAALERSGLISRVRGRGTFVHDAARERMKSGLDLFALVIPEVRAGFYPSLQRGFHDASTALHNQVLVCDTDNDPFRQADALLQLLDKKVAGIALVPTTIPLTPAHQIRPLHERGVPVVFCHRRVEGIQAPLVSFSALDVGRMAGREVSARGHRLAAFFGAQRGGMGPLYEQGFREAIRASGAELPDEFVRYDTTHKITAEHERFVETNLADILRQPRRPTAIFCPFDAEAELAYLTLARLGFKVPGDVSIISFGGAWREGALTRRLTSVTVDEEELGRRAAQLLHEMRMRERPLDDGTEVVLPLNLSTGETLGPAPA
jgi:GntR family transcriptional regulator of arabinose operon